MLVVIDRDPWGGVHVIDTAPSPERLVQHPNGSGPTTIDVMLVYINGDPSARDAGGWNVSNQLAEESAPLTRWQRLVRACNGPDATEQAKSLGLHE
jgi:hypothetical protein